MLFHVFNCYSTVLIPPWRFEFWTFRFSFRGRLFTNILENFNKFWCDLIDVSLFSFNFNFDEHNVLNLSHSAFPNFHFGTPEDPVVLYLTLSLMRIGKWSLPQVCCSTCHSEFALIVGDASVISGVVSWILSVGWTLFKTMKYWLLNTFNSACPFALFVLVSQSGLCALKSPTIILLFWSTFSSNNLYSSILSVVLKTLS